MKTKKGFLARPSQNFLHTSKLFLTLAPQKLSLSPVLSVRFEVGVSLLLAPTGANKRGPFSSRGVSGYAPPENVLNREARKHDFQ